SNSGAPLRISRACRKTIGSKEAGPCSTVKDAPNCRPRPQLKQRARTPQRHQESGESEQMLILEVANSSVASIEPQALHDRHDTFLVRVLPRWSNPRWLAKPTGRSW